MASSSPAIDDAHTVHFNAAFCQKMFRSQHQQRHRLIAPVHSFLRRQQPLTPHFLSDPNQPIPQFRRRFPTMCVTKLTQFWRRKKIPGQNTSLNHKNTRENLCHPAEFWSFCHTSGSQIPTRPKTSPDREIPPAKTGYCQTPTVMNRINGGTKFIPYHPRAESEAVMLRSLAALFSGAVIRRRRIVRTPPLRLRRNRSNRRQRFQAAPCAIAHAAANRHRSRSSSTFSTATTTAGQ